MTVRLNFVIIIAGLLASTCITWIIECFLKYKYIEVSGVDTPCFD